VPFLPSLLPSLSQLLPSPPSRIILDRRVLDWVVGLDSEINELVEGSDLYGTHEYHRTAALHSTDRPLRSSSHFSSITSPFIFDRILSSTLFPLLPRVPLTHSPYPVPSRSIPLIPNRAPSELEPGGAAHRPPRCTPCTVHFIRRVQAVQNARWIGTYGQPLEAH
jgi:hypothetical protein